MSVSPVKKRVSYFYDSSMGNYNYGYRHCMKPHRIRIIHDLLMSYGLGQKMEIYRPQKATAEDMTKFHSDEYIRFLERIRPDNKDDYNEQMQRFNLNSDCPIFDGLYEFCQLSVGGSVSAAVVLNKKSADICINWGGGFHHAKNVKASGFCYVNDIVLGILELLKHHQRVLYIDIDVHHGDGVEEAFFTTDRVMTVSFHQYDGIYFPGTGDLGNIGAEKGKYYALNVPLQYGIDDDSYESIFVPIITNVMASFQPSAVVLQCGADSLAGDKLGYFNLTVKGHGKCVEFVKRFEIPLLLVGGGGYTLKNVTRCWTYETAVALGVEIANELPSNEHLKHFGPDYKLHTNPSKRIINKNNKKSLEEIKSKIFENLRMLPHAPAVQIQDIPEDGECHDLEYKDNVNPDERNPQSITDKRIAPDNEFSDSDDERMVPGVRGSERKDNRSFKTVAPARKQACLDSNRMEVDEPEFNMLRAQTSLMSNAHTLCIETSGEITNNLKDELDIDNQITNNRQLGDQFMLAETQDNSEEEDDSKQFMYLLYKQNVLSINDDEDEGIGLTSSNDNNTQKNQSPIPGSSKGPLMTTTATDEIIDLDNYVVNEVPSRFNLDNQKSEGRLPKIKKSLSALKKQHSAPVPPPVPIQQSLHSRGRLPLFPNVTFLRTTSDPNAFIVRLAMDNIDRTFAEKITDYEIFLCIENGEMSGNWSHISTVKAAPLPVDYTLCKHLPGMKYYISVRSVDTYHQVGPFCPAKLVC